MERFQDRRIIVTGGGSGIGRATVLRLLAGGGHRAHRRRRRARARRHGRAGRRRGHRQAPHHRGARRLGRAGRRHRRARHRRPPRRARRARERGRDPARRAHARVHARHVEPGDQRQPHRHVPHVPRRDPRAARVGPRGDRELQLHVGGVRSPVHGGVRGEQGRHRRDDAHARDRVRQARDPRRPRSRPAASRAASPRRPAG